LRVKRELFEKKKQKLKKEVSILFSNFVWQAYREKEARKLQQMVTLGEVRRVDKLREPIKTTDEIGYTRCATMIIMKMYW
jgi:hypothetical protein